MKYVVVRFQLVSGGRKSFTMVCIKCTIIFSVSPIVMEIRSKKVFHMDIKVVCLVVLKPVSLNVSSKAACWFPRVNVRVISFPAYAPL